MQGAAGTSYIFGSSSCVAVHLCQGMIGKMAEGYCLSEVDQPGLELGSLTELFLLSLRKFEPEPYVSISTLRALAAIMKGCEQRNVVGLGVRMYETEVGTLKQRALGNGVP